MDEVALVAVQVGQREGAFPCQDPLGDLPSPLSQLLVALGILDRPVSLATASALTPVAAIAAITAVWAITTTPAARTAAVPFPAPPAIAPSAAVTAFAAFPATR